MKRAKETRSKWNGSIRSCFKVPLVNPWTQSGSVSRTAIWESQSANSAEGFQVQSQLQPQNIKPSSPGNLNARPVDNPPRLVTFAGTAQNKAIDPSSRYQSLTIRPIESSAPTKKLLPVPVATIANQPVIANATVEGYQTDSTAINRDGAVAVFLGISVCASLTGELVAGDKTYAPLPSVLAEPIRSTIDVIHEKIPRCYVLEGPVVTAGVAVAITIGSNGGPKSIAIGDQSFAVTSMRPSQTASIGANVVVTETLGIYHVDGAVVTADGSTGRVSHVSVSVSASSDGRLVVGSQVGTLASVNATRKTDGGAITTGAPVNTPHGKDGTSSAAGISTSQVKVGKGRRIVLADSVRMISSVGLTLVLTSLHTYC